MLGLKCAEKCEWRAEFGTGDTSGTNQERDHRHLLRSQGKLNKKEKDGPGKEWGLLLSPG